MHPASAGALFVGLLSSACAEPMPPPVPPAPAPTVEAEGPSPTTHADPSQARTELDHTVWDCGWSILVFWDANLHWVHRDVAMAAMGGSTLFAREDHDLDYGSAQTFDASIRYREYPQGQRGPESFDDAPARTYVYRLEGNTLRVEASEDEPLECGRGCYDQAFIEFMDARYGTATSADAIADKMGIPGCS